MNKELNFRADGTFKIVQFTDLHWENDCQDDIDRNLKTIILMESIIKEEKPDLIVITGDLVYSEDNERGLREILVPVRNSGIPFATVFGNHDTEKGSGKEVLYKVLKESELCLSEAGNPEITGLCNYVLNVKSKDNKPCWMLFFLDSGFLNQNPKMEGYDFIKRDQINWYVDEAASIKKSYGEVPALSFFHIALPEYNEVWNRKTCYGEKNEEVCCPEQNSGLFSAMIEMGDVKGIFVGHDHINDYYGELHGIKLCFGRATGYNSYGKKGFLHGARIIKLYENNTEFETWIRLEDGTVINNPSIHEPEYI